MEKEDKNVKKVKPALYDFIPDQLSFRKHLMKKHKNSQLMDKHDFKGSIS